MTGCHQYTNSLLQPIVVGFQTQIEQEKFGIGEILETMFMMIEIKPNLSCI